MTSHFHKNVLYSQKHLTLPMTINREKSSIPTCYRQNLRLCRNTCSWYRRV